MQLKHLILFLTVVLTESVLAQTKIGISTGITSSKHSGFNPLLNSTTDPDNWFVGARSNSVNSFSASFDLKYELNRKWYLSGSIGYIQKGQIEKLSYQYPGETIYNGAIITDEINYFNLPLKINYRLSEIKKVQISIGIGAYMGVGINGKTTTEIMEYTYEDFYIPSQNYSNSIFFESSITNRGAYNETDVIVTPIDYGAISELVINVSRVEFFLGYQLGIKNIHSKIDNIRPVSIDSTRNEIIKRNRSLVIGIRFWAFRFE